MPKTPPDHSSSARTGTLADLRRLRQRQRRRNGAARPESTPVDQAVPDRTLFLQAMQHVKPLDAPTRYVAHGPAAPNGTALSETLRQRRAHAAGDHQQADASLLSDLYQAPGIQHDDSSFVRAGHDPRLVRRLCQGKQPPDAWLDLHGFDLDTARLQLDQFIHTCLAQHWRHVHIVHGKGHGSPHSQPVLKQAVRRWLTQYDAILAFSECAEHHGGAGALRALLRNPQKPYR